MAKRKGGEVPSSASFEESLGELQGIVSELEDGSIGLETSLARFERGVRLLRDCYSILDAAEAKVEILTRFEATEAITVPFESAATFDLKSPVDTSGSSDSNSLGESESTLF